MLGNNLHLVAPFSILEPGSRMFLFRRASFFVLVPGPNLGPFGPNLGHCARFWSPGPKFYALGKKFGAQAPKFFAQGIKFWPRASNFGPGPTYFLFSGARGAVHSTRQRKTCSGATTKTGTRPASPGTRPTLICPAYVGVLSAPWWTEGAVAFRS